MRRRDRDGRIVFWGALLALTLLLPASAAAQAPGPTTSSPIALSSDGRYVWNVNPAADTVSIISTSSKQVVRRVPVGDEPASVALDPRRRYAYVANPGNSTLTVIRTTFNRRGRLRTAGAVRRVTTGAENWNVVVSPDGRRVFVSNSAQDTVTVLNRAGRIIGHVDLGQSVCNQPDTNRIFQPRGLAVTRNNRYLFVTSFLAYVRPGGRQATDTGKEGVVCKLRIETDSNDIEDYRPVQRIAIGPQPTGFAVDSTGDATPDPTQAYPNQLQSIVLRGNYAFLPGIAASPAGPIRFNVNTQAFVNVLRGVNSGQTSDDSTGKFLNLHLGARTPEAGKKKLFFAGPWAIAFTNQSGSGSALVVAQNSDLLVKVNVAGNGQLSFTGGPETTTYIDLNDPANPQTAGDNAGKNPQGIVMNRTGSRAWVVNHISRNVSYVNVNQNRVERVIRTAPLPPPNSPQEVVAVGAEQFFSSRGHYDRPAGVTVSTDERLSSEGWQACSSCHFEGLTDGNVWVFAAGPRMSIGLNASFNPNNPQERRALNWSAIRDEPEDFEENTRNVSGPGPLVPPGVACNAPAPGMPAVGTLDPAHGLLVGDNGDRNLAPCVLNNFNLPNADRQQHTVTLPGAGRPAIPAWTAMREWIRLAVRTPNAPLAAQSARRDRPARPGLDPAQVNLGRQLFAQAGCTNCHVGGLWTISSNNLPVPPPAGELFTERTGTFVDNPVGAQFIQRFIRDIGSFNLGVPGQGNDLGANIGADEKAAAPLPPGQAAPAGVAQDALGRDYNNDGNGIGFSPASLLGINVIPPYYHNGACESLRCVVDNVKHRTANGTLPDRLPTAEQREAVTAFLKSIDARTPPF